MADQDDWNQDPVVQIIVHANALSINMEVDVECVPLSGPLSYGGTSLSRVEVYMFSW